MEHPDISIQIATSYYKVKKGCEHLAPMLSNYMIKAFALENHEGRIALEIAHLCSISDIIKHDSHVQGM